MKIISCEEMDLSSYGKKAAGKVYCIHVKIESVKERADEMIKVISDTSWIEKLGVVNKKSYAVRAQRTIDRLVKNIFEKVDSFVTEEFGEYLVSETASAALNGTHKHVKLPLAELWKEKIIGNPGFDFHTEGPNELIFFGEAKYSGTINPHTVAMKQITAFIKDGKDFMELADLKNLCSTNAANNAADGKKAYVAAFSLNGKDHQKIFINALKSGEIDPLLAYPSLYLIGIEV